MINIKKCIKKFLGLEKFVSSLDRFLMQYDKDHPKPSASQQQEINKYNIINAKRDQKQSIQPQNASIINQFLD